MLDTNCFLKILLNGIQESDADLEAIYPLLLSHTDQLTEQFPKHLKEWAIATFPTLEPEQQRQTAKDISNLSLLIRSFSLGNKAINIEIAIAGYEAAIQVLTRESFPFDWAATQNNLGVAYCDRILGERSNNLERAITCFESALQIRTREILPEEWANTCNNLGIAYKFRILGSRQQNFRAAIACHKNALQVQTLIESSEDWATSHWNLGNVYSEWTWESRSRYQERAIWHYQQASQVYTQDTHPMQWAGIQDNLGALYQERRQGKLARNLEQAIAHHQRALQVYTYEATPRDWATTQSNLGAAYYRWFRDCQSGNLQLAIACYQSALQVHHRENLPQDYVATSFCLGLSYRLAQQFTEAYTTFAAAIDIVESLRRQVVSGEEVKQKLAEEWNLLYQAMVEVCLALGYPDKALEYVERSKTRNLAELLAERTADTRLRLLRFDQMQALLPDDQTAILEWYVTPETLIVFIVVCQEAQPIVWHPPDTEVAVILQSLIDWFNRYLDEYENDRTVWQQYLGENLADLSQILKIETLLSLLPLECDQIILIPHWFLHLLPLHALPLEANVHLCDRFPKGVRYAPSCQLLHMTRTEPLSALEHLIALQNPTADLAYAELEVAGIQRYFATVTVLKQAQASEAALLESLAIREAAKSYEEIQDIQLPFCLHFSSHGYFNSMNPRQSALVLANAIVKDTPNEGKHDQYLQLLNGMVVDLQRCLTLKDIFSLRLSSCRLVVLSACETGQIDVHNVSDEYVGLPSGWLYAGSPSVISSLWQVDDLSTALLMIRFYENLHSGWAVAIALNKAQSWLRQVRKKELEKWLEELQGCLSSTIRTNLRRRLYHLSEDDPLFQEPFYWAGFCAIGQ